MSDNSKNKLYRESAESLHYGILDVLPVVYTESFYEKANIFFNKSLWRSTTSNHPPISTLGYEKNIAKLEEKKWDKMSKDEILSWMKKMDAQALFKSLSFDQRKEPRIHFAEKNKIGKKKLEDVLKSLRNWRNDNIGHFTSSTFEGMSKETFLCEIVKPVRDLCELLRKNKDMGTLFNKVKEVEKRIGYPDITIESLIEQTALTRNEILETLETLKIGFENNTIKGEDNSELVDRILKLRSWNNDDAKNKQKAKAKSNDACKKDIFTEKKLSDQQIENIASNYNVVIDSSALRNDSYSRVLMNVVTPSLKSKSRVAIVFRRTRMVLSQGRKKYYDFKKSGMKDEDNPYTEYKTAINKLDTLVAKKMVKYAEGYSNSFAEEDDICELINSHRNNKIALFSNDDEYLTEELLNESPLLIGMRCIENRVFVRNKYLCRENKDVGISKPSDDISNKTESVSKKNDIEADTKAEAQQQVNEKKSDNSKKARVSLNDELVLDSGATIVLKKEIGSGGEGKVYDTNIDGIVAKIYHDKKLNSNRQMKLQYMVKNQIDNTNIIWPINLVLKNGTVVGYTMKKLPGEGVELGLSVLKLSSKAVQNSILKGWNRKEIVGCALAILNLFDSLHKKNILMGDINPRNIIVDPADQKRVWFVDCDSYQMDDYRCPVGTPIFTSPRIYNKYGNTPNYSKFSRTIEDEEYAVASLLFQMLMLGQNPFASKREDNTSIEDAIKLHKFSYSRETDEDMPDGPYRMIWFNIIQDVKNNFEKVFLKDEMIDDSQWMKSLNSYRYSIEKEYVSNELYPTKYRSQNGQFDDFVCEICGTECNMPHKKYERLKSFNQPLYCNNCGIFLNTFKGKKTTVYCTNCGVNKVEVPEKTKIINEFRRDRGDSLIECLCAACQRADDERSVLAKCEMCGAETTVPNKIVKAIEWRKRLNEEHDPILCANCYRQKKGW